MACKHCDYKGFILVSQLINNIEVKQVRPCEMCHDMEAYYKYVKEKYAKMAQENIKKMLMPISDEYDNVLDLIVYRRNKVIKYRPINNLDGNCTVLDLNEFRKRKS